MRRIRPKGRSVVLACTLSAVGALACALAYAEPVYKYRMPDGRVIYSDKPVSGGRLEREVQPQPPVGPEISPPPSAQPADVDKRIAARREALEAAWRELEVANAALAEAQKRLDSGRAPLPEEIKPIWKVGARVGEEYEHRQAVNTRAVDEAKARVKRAEQELNRVRY
jgi:hypothetical protein